MSSSAAPTADCPLFGPSFPSGVDVRYSDAFQKAISAFPKALAEEFSVGSLNKSTSIFAIDVFSTVSNSSVFQHYYVGNDGKDSVIGGKLGDKTISRIGSVSKVWTVYAILATAGMKVFNDPVTKYLPELAGNASTNPIERVNWTDVTVGALASQQGGSGGVPLAAFDCGNKPGECSIPAFLETMRDEKHPTEPPFQNPLYSDGGFAILGRVLERLTGKPYNDALQVALAKPLGLNSTSSVAPHNKHLNAIVVPGGINYSSWGVDNQIAASTGGVYTNGADLRKLGLSILNSELLTPSESRRWFKPLGHTTSLTFAVGAPWEIHRLALPVTPKSNRTRTLDLYTKLGGNTAYSGVLALDPDHGIGYSIMAAGPNAIPDRYTLRDLVGDIFLPAAEHAAFENAKKNYAGTFSHPTMPGTNLTLTVDEGFAGLGLESFYFNNSDARILLGAPLSLAATDPFKVRIYHTGLTSKDSISALYTPKPTAQFSYRAVLDYLPYADQGPAREGKSMFMQECESWESVGFADGYDELILGVVNGKLQRISHGLFPGEVLNRLE
ncbi:beta-lactamase/transpeptidase-like protein [Mariannaea sp. PMI_226]|nr:beta-lactamase/transpeptidase-like protein [Mariannaea sp. PMI_226]